MQLSVVFLLRTWVFSNPIFSVVGSSNAIIGIEDNEYNKQQRESHCRDAMHCVSTQSNAFPASSKPSKNQFGPQSKKKISIHCSWIQIGRNNTGENY
ncbi:MAG: hypothetical protein EA412_04170 [Chitinophagaceae bacterium]|nr:MAG: hypothetical protein EA412_04170 [Chitinophagaceae bacterium]